jgi:flap endonuclease-1
MGILKFFQTIIPDGKRDGSPLGSLARETSLVKLKGARVCVDSPNMIYSAILAMSHITALTDASGKTTAHINTIFAKILQLDAAGIRQIWIFDSPEPNPIKAEANKKRHERAFNSNDPKVQFRMNSEHVEDIKTLLNLMGVPYVQAPPGIEAEMYGAWMTRGDIVGNRFCQYMISADSDVLAFGGNLLRPYQKPSSTGKSKRLVYQIYELHDILQETSLTYKQFLTLCVALGTDFNPKTAGVGEKTAIKKVKDDMIDLTDLQQRVISYYSSTPTRNKDDAHFSKYDKDGLVAFLVSRGFNEARITERLAKYPK